MSYEFKKGDRVVCVFSKTSDDKGDFGRARKGRVIQNRDGYMNEYIVNFGRGFGGHSGGLTGHRKTCWFVWGYELGLLPKGGIK